MSRDDIIAARERARATPCSVRCWRVGTPVPTEPGQKCVECGRIEPGPVDVASSEVALAKVLAAWETFPDVKWSPAEPLRTLGDVSTALGVGGYIVDGRLSPMGHALLERARKAGIL